jgi:hypothetical protein
MEAIEIASHVEFFAKACTAIVEVLETGRYRVKTNRESLQSHSLVAYYFGHCEKSNFFFSDGIGWLHFVAAEGRAASTRIGFGISLPLKSSLQVSQRA